MAPPSPGNGPQSHDLLPLAPRDTLADAKARKRSKRRERLDPDYLSWIHQFPCVVCGLWPVEAHHEPPKSAEGGSLWHDRKVLPLCAAHHRGRWGRGLGYEGFCVKYALDVPALIAGFNRLYDEGREP